MSGVFTGESKVRAYVASNLLVCMICNVMDGMITIQIGVIKGLGKQVYATVAYVVCFYGISVPCTFLFCFSLKMGLQGLWIGLSCGLFVLFMILNVILAKSDWEEEALKAIVNIEKES